MFQAVVAMMVENGKQQTAILQAQIASQQTEARELRAELREIRNQPKEHTGMSVVKELIGEFKTILPDIKDLLPFSDSRPRNMPWWAGVLERFAEGAAPAIPMIVSQLMSNANAHRPQPQNGIRPSTPLPTTQAINPAPTTTPQSQIDVDTMLLSALDSGRDGEDVADALCSYYGDDGRRLYAGLLQMGEAGILQLIQSRPVWDRLGPHQAKIPEFIKQFVGYDTQGDEGAPQGEDAAGETPVEVI